MLCVNYCLPISFLNRGFFELCTKLNLKQLKQKIQIINNNFFIKASFNSGTVESKTQLTQNIR